jgi:predicted transcriptional regulator
MKTVVAARVSEKGLEWLDKIAEEEDRTRSDVMKAALMTARDNEDRVRKYLQNRETQ